MDRSKHNAQVFGKVAKAYAQRYYEDRTDLPWVDRLLEPAPTGSNILDVACGPGMYTDYVIAKGYNGFGIDLAPEMVEIAEYKVPKGHFSVQDMVNLQFPDEYFSALLAMWAIAYIPSKKIPQLFIEFKRVLTPTGRLLIVVQKGRSDHVERASLDFTEKLYVNFFQPEQLSTLIENANFKIIDQRLVSSSDPHSMSSDLIYVLAEKN